MRSSGPTREGSELTQMAVGRIWFLTATERRLPEVLCISSEGRSQPGSWLCSGQIQGGSFCTLTLDMTSHPFYHILCIRSTSPGPAHTRGERMPRNVSHKLHLMRILRCVSQVPNLVKTWSRQLSWNKCEVSNWNETRPGRHNFTQTSFGRWETQTH